MVYPSAQMKTDLFNMLWFSFPPSSDMTLYEPPPGVSSKAEDAYPTGAPGPCSQFWAESKLLIYFCYLVCNILFIGYFMFFVMCICFPCLIFVPRLHPFNFHYNLVPSVTFWKKVLLIRLLHPFHACFGLNKCLLIVLQLKHLIYFLIFRCFNATKKQTKKKKKKKKKTKTKSLKIGGFFLISPWQSFRQPILF